MLRSTRSTPLHRHPTERPLPHAPFGPCFGPEGTTLEIPFRPRGFAPPRRLPPLGGRGLVASRCQSWGSPRFRLSGSWPTPGRIQVPSGVPMPSPRRFSHPSKDSPRPQPHHVTVAVAPLPFSPIPLRTSNRLCCQSRPSLPHRTGASASRPCSAVESVTSARSLPTERRPLLPGLRSPSRSFLTTRHNPRLARRTESLPPFPKEPRSRLGSSVSLQTSVRSRRNATDREAQPTPKRWRASHRGDGAAVKRRRPGSAVRTISLRRLVRLFTHRANPIGKKTASTESIRSRSSRCSPAGAHRLPGLRCGRHHRPSWGL